MYHVVVKFGLSNVHLYTDEVNVITEPCMLEMDTLYRVKELFS